MAVRLAINGFGRIGRNFARIALGETSGLELVAVNDIVPTATNAHLLKYDTTRGTLAGPVSHTADTITAAGRTFKVLSTNQLDEGCMASPAIVGKALYVRTIKHLYCVEKKE